MPAMPAAFAPCETRNPRRKCGTREEHRDAPAEVALDSLRSHPRDHSKNAGLFFHFRPPPSALHPPPSAFRIPPPPSAFVIRHSSFVIRHFPALRLPPSAFQVILCFAFCHL